MALRVRGATHTLTPSCLSPLQAAIRGPKKKKGPAKTEAPESSDIVNIFKDAASKYGPREFSPNIIRRYEEPCGVKVLGEGFPAEMTDDEPEEPGYEVIAKR
jgi:hypothetical protein